jgi:hypothetical protein
MYQRLVFDFFRLGLLQKREIAGRLGLAGPHPGETDFAYSRRVLHEASENGRLARLAALVRTCSFDVAA